MSDDFIHDHTYLSRYFFDDDKLREHALREFRRAARSGRLIVFAGSMVSENFGYPEWKVLLELCFEVARADLCNSILKADIKKKIQGEIDELEKEHAQNRKFDGRVISSIIGSLLEFYTKDRRKGQSANTLVRDKLIKDGKEIPVQSPVFAITDSLKRARLITLNYDLEFENRILGIEDKTISERFAKLQSEIKKQTGCEPNAIPHSFNLNLPDGQMLASESFDRDRLDRLIEFALGSPSVDQHILHLHGNLLCPETMILSYRDYDRLYRKGGATKLPFEHALKMLFSANPVLMIGVGMTEPELNQILQEFVGDNPWRKMSPTFLLWNKPDARVQRMGEQDAKSMNLPRPIREQSVDEVRKQIRLDKLHRFGVLTIFSDEPCEETKSDAYRCAISVLKNSILDLSKHVNNHFNKKADLINLFKNESEDQLNIWREVRYTKSNILNFECSWHFDQTNSESCFHVKELSSSYLLVHVTRPGTRKALSAAQYAWSWGHDNTGTPIADKFVFFINMTLRLDTDSVLEQLRQYLCALKFGAPIPLNKLRAGREHIFREPGIFTPQNDEKVLIIFKGLERLFSKSGLPLSAEVENFFRDYLKAVLTEVRSGKNGTELCRIAIFGTRRMQLYFERIERQVERQLKTDAEQLGRKPSGSRIIHLRKRVIQIETAKLDDPNGYLQNLWKDFDLLVSSAASTAPGSDRRYARRTYEMIFGSVKFKNNFETADKRELAFAILTVMAFIGQPVEMDVLFHAPRVINALQIVPELPKKRAAFLCAFHKLKALNLIKQIGNPVPKHWNKVETSPKGDDVPKSEKGFFSSRFALHLSLQTELRERHGVELSEAVLSTSFNMSLYSAQPADSALPEPHVHDELGKLIDWFLGVTKDEPLYKKGWGDFENQKLASPLASAAARAALAVVRGFYSTSALLSLDRGDWLLRDDRRNGALTEHADRLERITSALRDIWEARLVWAKSNPSNVDNLGPAPIYPDEYVWLYNERGVVKLAQGDLYEARYCFDMADKVNRELVEYQDESHNWRRITLNQIVVDIERAKLSDAEDRLSRIESSLGIKKVERIRRKLQDAAPGEHPVFQLDIGYEDCLAVALTTGYRGLVAHLSGDLTAADEFFVLAIKMLEALDEQRASAIFRRHHASLLGATGTPEAFKLEISKAIASAESAQQMDVAYAARIMRAESLRKSEKAEDRRSAMKVLNDAIEYADLTDVHRVAIIARRSLADLKFANGDIDSALEHAIQAAAIAARYGLSLYKLTIRILIGRILHERGNPEAGKRLIDSAIAISDQVGYQRAIESAQTANADISGW